VQSRMDNSDTVHKTQNKDKQNGHNTEN
jgi:hypothetical protein